VGQNALGIGWRGFNSPTAAVMRPQAGVDLFEQSRAELFDPAWSMLQSLTIQKLSILRAPFSFLRSDPVLPSEEPGLCQYSGLTRFRF